MNELISSINWRNHLVGLIFFFLSLSLFSAALYFYLIEKKAYKETKNAALQQQAINSESEQLKELRDRYIDAYELYKARGLIGEAQRLNWIETLYDVADDQKIPKVNFTLHKIKASEDIDTPFWHPEVNIDLSSMRIDMDLKHEGDLYQLLNQMHAKAKGVFGIESCSIRSSDNKSEYAYLDGFKGNCKLRFYSLHDVTVASEEEVY